METSLKSFKSGADILNEDILGKIFTFLGFTGIVKFHLATNSDEAINKMICRCLLIEKHEFTICSSRDARTLHHLISHLIYKENIIVRYDKPTDDFIDLYDQSFGNRTHFLHILMHETFPIKNYYTNFWTMCMQGLRKKL